MRMQQRPSPQRLPMTPETHAILADLQTGIIGSALIGLIRVIVLLLA